MRTTEQFPKNVVDAARSLMMTPEDVFALMIRKERGEEMTREESLIVMKTIVQKRPCGDCNMCCTAPAIEESVLLNDEALEPKAACVECQHSTKSGCGIYNNRPEVCQDYYCLWSLGIIPANNYPMKRGVCWTFQSIDEGKGGLLVGHAMDLDEVMRDPYSMKIVEAYTSDKSPVDAVTIRSDKKAVSFSKGGEGIKGDIKQDDPLKTVIDESTSERFKFGFK